MTGDSRRSPFDDEGFQARACRLASLCAVLLLTACSQLPERVDALRAVLPTLDLGLRATLGYPALGTMDVGALQFSPAVKGKIVDRYGTPMVGVVLCAGASQAEASPVGETNAAGAYTISLDLAAMTDGPLQLWPYQPRTRFEPEAYAFEGILLDRATYDFAGVPSIYPVPAERDCR